MIDAIPIAEHVYQISEQEQCQMLRSHYHSCYNNLFSAKEFEPMPGIVRYDTNIEFPFLNAVFGFPGDKNAFEKCIDEQLSYFKEARLPFVWYLDEDTSDEVKQVLLDRGFQNLGVFRGVFGFLDQPIPDPVIPEGCSIEQVMDEQVLEEYNTLVCDTFSFPMGAPREKNKKAMWASRENPHATAFHWLMRQDGKIVATVTTVIEGDFVSFWNGATLPEMRKKGYSTTLRRYALQHAVARGCRYGASYLMAEGMAFGICSKLGYKTKWRFNVFLAPTN